MTDGEGEQSKPHLRGCARSFKQLSWLVKADLLRYEGHVGLKGFVRHFVFTPGFRYSTWMRLTGYLKQHPTLRVALYPLAKLYLLRLRYKFGIAIPEYTEVGPGLFINRFGGIYINGDVVIGSNVNLTHGVMLGANNRGKKRGCPVIGDRVFLAAGAKVIGAVTVGDGAVIGANAMVIDDVPPNGVMAAPPARLISERGSEGYINRQVQI
jgi:serine O-acetyltransferase